MIVAADLYRVQLPLVAPFRTAKSTTAVKEALLVRVEDADGVFGWGECVAQRDASYFPETIDDAWAALRDDMLPQLLRLRARDQGRFPATAVAALTFAMTDSLCRKRGQSFASYIGGIREWIDAGVAIGRIDDVREFSATLHSYADAGYGRMKLKIEPGYDIAPLTRAREELGTGVELAADANGSYSIEDATALIDSTERLHLQCIEQPCREPVFLPRHSRVCIDESVRGAADVERAAEARAADVVSVKPARLGGTDITEQVLGACAEHELDALPGGMLETGVGRAALLAFASLPGFTMTGDISASERYFGPEGDLTEPFVLEEGRIRVPTGPGIGVEPIPERLAACTVAHERITKKDR